MSGEVRSPAAEVLHCVSRAHARTGRKFPDLRAVHLFLGSIAAAAGQHQKAVHEFTKVLDFNKDVDKQRIAAVPNLEQLGYTFAGDDWMHPANDAAAIAPSITDELHAMLVKRADDLEGCPAGSQEERELAAMERAIAAYEAVRWPHGKISGGKG